MSLYREDLEGWMQYFWEHMTSAMESDKNTGKVARMPNGEKTVNYWHRKVKRIRDLQKANHLV